MRCFVTYSTICFKITTGIQQTYRLPFFDKSDIFNNLKSIILSRTRMSKEQGTTNLCFKLDVKRSFARNNKLQKNRNVEDRSLFFVSSLIIFFLQFIDILSSADDSFNKMANCSPSGRRQQGRRSTVDK